MLCLSDGLYGREEQKGQEKDIFFEGYFFKILI